MIELLEMSDRVCDRVGMRDRVIMKALETKCYNKKIAIMIRIRTCAANETRSVIDAVAREQVK